LDVCSRKSLPRLALSAQTYKSAADKCRLIRQNIVTFLQNIFFEGLKSKQTDLYNQHSLRTSAKTAY